MSHLLGGRVRHDPGPGHRSGIEPVLLAACVPARSGQFAIDGGTGSGPALLCLAARTGSGGLGVELDPARAALAAANVAANGMTLAITAGDLLAIPLPACDHAMANPPWHDPAATASPDPGRRLARRRDPGMLAAWAAALARPLRHRGTLTFVVAAALAAEALAATGAVCGSLTLFPLWPRAGTAAKLVLLQGVRGGRGPTRVLAGLVLHQTDGRFTVEAEAVLRDGAGLTL